MLLTTTISWGSTLLIKAEGLWLLVVLGRGVYREDRSPGMNIWETCTWLWWWPGNHRSLAQWGDHQPQQPKLEEDPLSTQVRWPYPIFSFSSPLTTLFQDFILSLPGTNPLLSTNEKDFTKLPFPSSPHSHFPTSGLTCSPTRCWSRINNHSAWVSEKKNVFLLCIQLQLLQVEEREWKKPTDFIHCHRLTGSQSQNQSGQTQQVLQNYSTPRLVRPVTAEWTPETSELLAASLEDWLWRNGQPHSSRLRPQHGTWVVTIKKTSIRCEKPLKNNKMWHSAQKQIMLPYPSRWFPKNESENHRERLNIFAAREFQVLPHPPERMCMQPTRAGSVSSSEYDSPPMTEQSSDFFTWYSALI